MSLSEKLIAAAKSGDTREVRKLLARGALFTKDQFGNTALHEAAWNGNTDIVKILLKSFCSVDGVNSNGFTPLHLASQSGHGKVVKTLLKWQADPSLRNQHGETGLHLVAKYDHANVIAYYVAAKVDLDVRGKDGNTALHIAAKLDNIESIKALVAGGADPGLRNEKGLLAVECAEAGGFRGATKFLQGVTQRAGQGDGQSGSRSATPVEREASKHTRSASASARLPTGQSKGAWSKKKKNSSPLERNHSVERLTPSPPLVEHRKEEVDGAPSQRSTSPSIEQLLSEIERECHGPDYKYQPPLEDSSQSTLDEDTPPPLLPAKTFLRSTRDGRPPLADNYDILEPRPDLPQDPQRFQHHTYETLPPLQQEDADTYVYMAPCSSVYRCNSAPASKLASDLPEASRMASNIPNGSFRPTKRAIICSSPVHLDTKHEPNSSRQPAKGILAQPSGSEAGRSQLDQYLQDELDTMRQAFQIRLSQLEKRYQRRLIHEQRRSGQRRQQRSTTPPPRHSPSFNSTGRSWSESMSDDEAGDRRNIDHIDEPDNDIASAKRNGGVLNRQPPRGAPGARRNVHRSPPKEGLKGGSRGWREEEEEEERVPASPQMSPLRSLNDGDGPMLTDEARLLIQQRTYEYRTKMTQYFKEKAEARISVIERQYREQMNEVERRCEARASDKLVKLEGRIKDLEHIMQVQTLV